MEGKPPAKETYSPENKRPKCFAPAITQVLASILMLVKIMVGIVLTLLKDLVVAFGP